MKRENKIKSTINDLDRVLDPCVILGTLAPHIVSEGPR